MRPLAAIALAVLFSACDSAVSPLPWFEPPARYAFDYEAGSNPIRFAGTQGPVPSVQRAVEMRIITGGTPGGGGSVLGPSARFSPNVTWDVGQRDGRIPDLSPFERTFSFAFDQTFSEIQGEVLVGYAPWEPRCAFRRLPLHAPPGAERSRVETRAGTFDTFATDRCTPLGGRVREFWHETAGLIRVDVFDAANALQGRFLRAPD